MIISLISAVAQNGIIGKNNDLPWHLPDDFAYFKKTTFGHPIIMGRKSLEALGKPLPGRTNIVITRDRSFVFADVTVVHSLDDALIAAKQALADTEHNSRTAGGEIFVIGGTQIYTLALPVANRLYLTEIDRAYEGDASFPSFDRAEWHEVSRRHHPTDTRHETTFDFVIYERK